MKKKHLKKMILLGVSSAAFMSTQSNAFAEGAPQNSMQQPAMTAEEQAFYAKLNEQAKSSFMSMNSQMRSMAMQMAAAGCKGKNACAGLGGCPTQDNSCKGKNACKGKGGGPVSPNDAVQMISQKMAEKRANLL